ncbi:uncharacterized protein LOC115223610 [Octopus sinensis]|uniref:Uncharacterized protein LOC115223610 n=1 Tax=Octopus sinensis TaxID=2607531 RepID=A0A6P7TM82_9MOLL|nr:uncharacterized protein LOC115223610 [Octopus sinensis]
MLFTNRKSGPDFLLWPLIPLLLVMSQTVTGNTCGTSSTLGITKPFEAHIEGTFTDKSTSILIKEYFQPTGSVDNVELGAVVQTFNGEKIQAILNYTSSELFYIADDVCTVAQGIPRFTNLLPDNRSNVENAFIYSTKDILRMLQDTVCVSLPNGTVRGIEAEHFHGKLEDNVQFQDVVVDIYISRDNWTTANDYTKPEPLRIEFCGKVKSSGKTFCNYFDYFYFNYDPNFTFKERESVFEIPPGVYCTGRKTESDIPYLPLEYFVTIEFVDPAENSVKISKLWVSEKYQMVRRDFHPISYADAGHPVTEIYNYLTGTVYTRDNLMLNCSYNTLQNADTNDDDILQHILDVMNGKATRMVDTLQILQLDRENTFYNGQRSLRNVVCDVFISMKTIQTDSGASKNVTFEYYFMTNDWKLIPDRGGPESVITQIPMMLEISYSHKGHKRNFFYNFFDFSDVVSYKDFDTSACYNQTREIVFKIAFKGQYIPSLINAFEKKAHSQIADYGKVNPFRVQNMHLTYDDDYVFVFASIIDPAPPETLFTLHENKMIKSKTNRNLMFKKMTLNLCAVNCVEYSGCYGFELTADGVCTITTMVFSEQKSDSQLQDSQGTNFYARTIMHHIKWESNSNVWNKLFSSVYNRIWIFT